MTTTLIRCTVVDADGTISFIAPAHLSKALVAACSRGAADHRALLEEAARYDPAFVTRVTNGLAVFDEHNTRAEFDEIRERLSAATIDAPTPFRVVDAVTREASLSPAGAGLVVYNLTARRIVQVQNSYADLKRQDLGRLRENGKPTRALYRYELPTDWALLP